MDKKPDSSSKRNVLAFINIDEFYNTLQDRLHVAQRRFGFVSGEYKHTMWIIAVPRKKTLEINRNEVPDLIYAGIDRQQTLLEGSPLKETNEYWANLKKTELENAGVKVSSELYKSIVEESLTIEKILTKAIGKLNDYFLPVTNHKETEIVATERQKNEYEIIKCNNLLEDYWYMSLPLIGFGEFDGIVHIVLHENDLEKFGKPLPNGTQEWKKVIIGNLIKLFSWEYEALILDWDIVGPNKYTSSLIPYVIKELRSKKFWDYLDSKSPILKELAYKSMYLENIPYYSQRYLENQETIRQIYDQQLRNATTSILIDSYAHNVSAHSLTALSWWFQQRAIWRKLPNQDPKPELIKAMKQFEGEEGAINVHDADEIRAVVGRMAQELEKSFQTEASEDHAEADNSVVYNDASLAGEIHVLLNFLAEKGAFWSGVTRDQHFGGEVKDLYSLLWYDFINNPLYLGTIAKTEDITKIRLKVVIYEPEHNRTTTGPVGKQIELQGEFASLDIKSPPSKDCYNKENELYYVEIPGGRTLVYGDRNIDDGTQNHGELADRSPYVRPGAGYEALKNRLQRLNAFFPGGVVGRHALLTILENEIRNIKHYSGESLKSIHRDGLTLTLAIQPAMLNPDTPVASAYELFKIGVWIETPTQLDQKIRSDQSPYLLKRKYDALHSSVMEKDSFAPILGGTYQDKVCAAMLFNNEFSSVQNGDSDTRRLGTLPEPEAGDEAEEFINAMPKTGKHASKVADSDRDRHYYPWIVPATSIWREHSNGQTTEEAVHEDFEMKGLPPKDEAAFEQLYSPHLPKGTLGYIKKYFFLWQGENVKDIETIAVGNDWENISRFRIARVQELNGSQWKSARKSGVIRIIGLNTTVQSDPKKAFLEGYHQWLILWFGSAPRGVEFWEERPNADIKKFGLAYLGEGHKQPFSFDTHALTDPASLQKLRLAHKSDSLDKSVLRLRTHGIYKRYFCDPALERDDLENALRMAELLEVLATRICVFDNRVHQRVRGNAHYDSVLDQINLTVKDEDIETWQERKQQIKNCHFLVMHLTFIDNILREYHSDNRYEKESRIGIFIEKELFDLVKDSESGKIRKNFLLVITTGRGRKDWWDYLANSPNPVHKSFISTVVFRPVESIISGIVSAAGKEDDIELKYNITKVMFGS